MRLADTASRRCGPGLLAVAMIVGIVTSLTGCGTGGTDSSSPNADRLDVLASFYPLQFVTAQIGGPDVSVDNLTPIGVDPHDVELTPQEVAKLVDATNQGLVAYLAGFQPAVDDAVATASDGANTRVLNIDQAAQLTLHAADAKMSSDPHFWLDPLRLSAVSQAIADRLSTLDPSHADAYAMRTRELQRDLRRLDRAYSTGLATCRSRDLVTSHQAFGYLAQRYNLTQRGIVGLNPEAEPTPAELAQTAQFVKANDVTTIFYEPLVSPDVANTVARETGTTTAILDPIEGLTSSDSTSNYFSLMRNNLQALRTGLGCT